MTTLKFITIFMCIYFATCQTTAPSVAPCPASQSNVCRNGGFCVILFGVNVTCTCPVGFTGFYCEISQNVATTATPAATVTINTGFTAATTFAAVVPCVPSQDRCQNGGFCVVIFGRDVECTCPVGFTGSLCEIRESSFSTVTSFTIPTATSVTSVGSTAALAICPAGTRNCLNGGQCFIINGNNAICSCLSGFTGSFCETQVTSSPSTVIFVTTTTTPSIGTTAVLPLSICPNGVNPCLNQGQCLVVNGKDFFCGCLPGFTGEFCEKTPIAQTSTTTTTTTATTIAATTAIASCSASLNICKNGGICLVFNGKDIKCVCSSNFIGIVCETEIATSTTTTSTATTSTTTTSTTTLITTTSDSYTLCPSEVNICQNNANCVLKNAIEIICACLTGFSGNFCEASDSVCFPDPCDSGECIPNADNTDFTCKCDPGFFGLFCETQSCSPDPCQNEQPCVISLKGPTCLCANAYTGIYCENIV